jgi:cyclopropane-fatty-acyl-phospholipid synthase
LQQRFQSFAGRLRAHDIPLRIRLENGSEVNLGSEPCVTIVPTSVSGLRYLLAPSLGKLGEAYVEGLLNIEGSIMDIVDVVARLSEKVGRPEVLARGRLRMAQHGRKADAKDIAYHYDLSNDFYALWLDSGMNYSCAYFKHEDDSLEIAQQQKITHILRKLRLREQLAGYRLRLGFAGHACGCGIRRQRGGGDAVRTAVSTG